jgi:hypothetical protein
LREKKIQILPKKINGKIVFEPLIVQGGSLSFGCVDGMDLKFDGHPWCKSNNISMNNLPFGVK